jgi:hypothetical protein
MALPLLTTDTIKEALAVVFPVNSAEESNRLSAASYDVLFAVASHLPMGILEAVWGSDGLARSRLRELKRPMVEILCHCPPEMLIERFFSRLGGRHRVHREHYVPRSIPLERLRKAGDWPALDVGPLVKVDTSYPIDVPALLSRIYAALDGRVG